MDEGYGSSNAAVGERLQAVLQAVFSPATRPHTDLFPVPRGVGERHIDALDRNCNMMRYGCRFT